MQLKANPYEIVNNKFNNYKLINNHLSLKVFMILWPGQDLCGMQPKMKHLTRSSPSAHGVYDISFHILTPVKTQCCKYMYTFQRLAEELNCCRMANLCYVLKTLTSREVNFALIEHVCYCIWVQVSLPVQLKQKNDCLN